MNRDDVPNAVYVVVADYGLNGAGCLGVFAVEPSEAVLDELVNTNFDGLPYGPRSVPGFGGVDVVVMEVDP